MTTTTYEPLTPETDLRRQGIRLGDIAFKGIAIAAALATAALLGLIAWKVFDLAWPAVQNFGLSFIWTEAWDPVTEQFGALIFIYGTIVTSVIALVIATPLSIAIALFLSEIAPRRVAAPIATMVELLAAIPSVVLGLWGILVFGPWVRDHLEPWIQDTPLGARRPSQLSCSLYRGNPDSPILMQNHWLALFPPVRAAERVIGTAPALRRRIAECTRERGRGPGIVAVDFYEQTAVVRVARTLNAQR